MPSARAALAEIEAVTEQVPSRVEEQRVPMPRRTTPARDWTRRAERVARGGAASSPEGGDPLGRGQLRTSSSESLVRISRSTARPLQEMVSLAPSRRDITTSPVVPTGSRVEAHLGSRVEVLLTEGARPRPARVAEHRDPVVAVTGGDQRPIELRAGDAPAGVARAALVVGSGADDLDLGTVVLDHP
jgi:hypothetical protein